MAGAAAAGAAAAIILWIGRDTSFSADELVLFMDTPGLGLRDALEPYNGHLLLVTRLVYKGVLETFGSDYLPFRALTVVALLLAVTLFFLYARRRIGTLAALAPVPVLVLFGSAYTHVLVGNGFTILLSIAFGLAALLALDRGDRAGDVAAAAFLTLGVLTYSFALPFVIAVAVAILLRDDRWRRAWVFLVPTLIYAAWWLWALGQPHASEDHIDVWNLLLLPAWSFQSLATSLSALVGLDYRFTEESTSEAGSALALVAIVALAWRLRRGGGSPALWGILAGLVGLWILGVLGTNDLRPPNASRYLFGTTFFVLLLAVLALAGRRASKGALVAAYLVAAMGLAVNFAALRDGGAILRQEATRLNVEQTVFELTQGKVEAGFDPKQVEGASAAFFGLTTLLPQSGSPVAAYLTAAERYGGLGFSAEELATKPEPVRAQVDLLLAAAEGIRPEPAAAAEISATCRRVAAQPDGNVVFELPPEGVVLEAEEPAGPLGLRRFADVTVAEAGELPPRAPALLQAPPDGAAQPWLVVLPAESARVCAPA